MRHSPVPRTTNVCSERPDVAERVIAFLRNRYPLKTAECVAADLKTKICTAEKWLERVSAPSTWIMLRMVSAYGPEFLAAVMGDSAPQWLRESAHIERRAQIEAQMAALQQELQSL